ncbi:MULTISPECIES: NADH-quinone oxidoreductase subunit NuoK [Reichenbachiella]|uniref:NADH-quinone oxidoreductase subunit K n=1 Tax=Reichenbachiella agariperforans TaxID=156994 RepID=A0A1M6QG66_REIAG|nr:MULTISPECIES: NADH-quinone oxidoreductase subunit NuoK [Reichenbachiella]MBU2914357.1 NADH-quinone oxidoreductase subunit NuoK [Reichenbachiella agariperforans]PIB35907.1 NADH-quinone oxidoreductase subunit K [Reichenbachiella sp. 5M10]SHK19100.1 NADH dehydrogenase subunit K [Reichenbachiella agariperforans]
MIPIEHYIVLSAALLIIGLMIIIIKRNAIMVLVGVELILNAANINLVAFAKNDPLLTGQMMSLFVIVIAVAESAVALAIIYQVYRHQQVSNIDELDELNG